MKNLLHHLFVPRESNNYRAKLLHETHILLAIVFLLLGTFFLSSARARYPSVLGISYDVTGQQLLSLTNQKRQASGLSPLTINPQLSQAAAAKASDMFSKNYWAHNAPDGTTPWVFIKQSHYDYLYAGENLARGFVSSTDVINAWMASTDHRENMLSPDYKDVGFAIAQGKLNGEDTVLVVEELGSTTIPQAAGQPPLQNVKSVETVPQTLVNKPLISSKSLSWNIGFIIIALFLFALASDMVLVERKKIVRIAGHNLDHVLFLAAILILVFFIIGKGAVL